MESKGADVSIKTVNGNIHIGSNDADTETVTAKNNENLEAVDGKIIIDGKTSTKDGDITLHATNTSYTPGVDGKNIIINQSGKVESGRDANLIAENGDLHVSDNVTAKGTLNAETRQNGDLYLDKNIDVAKDMVMQTESGSITVGKKVNAEDGSVTIKTGTGNVTIGEKVNAGQNVSVTTGTGAVTIGEDVTSGKNVSVTTGNGTVTVGSNGKGSVTAQQDVTVNVGKGAVDIVKSVTSNDGSVTVKSGEGDIHIGNNGPSTNTVTAKENVSLEAANGKITVDGKTSTQEGDITLKAANKNYVAGEAGKNIIINHTGKVESGGDANLIAVNGDLHVTDNVKAEGTLNAETQKQGDILLDENVNVVKDMSMRTQNGDITVGKQVNASQGSVSMTTGTGNVTVGEDVTAGKNVSVTTGTGNVTVGDDITAGNKVSMTTGTGNVTVGSNGQGSVTAGNNVAVNVGKGDVDIVKSVTSTGGSVNMKVQDGNIHVGNNGPTVDTVTAKQNVTLETANGKITVDGKTSTQVGDITLKAANKEYVAGEAGRNIIINQTGIVESGHDANLIAKNGDLHVTDRVTAQNTFNAKTEVKGDILLDDDVEVVKDMAMQTDNGNITVGKQVNAGKGSVSMNTGTGRITVGEDVSAGTDVNMTTGTGAITVGSNGKGNVVAGNNVAMTTGQGNVSVVKTVTAKNGDVDIVSGEGNIRIGDNGPGVKTVTAKQNVNLEARNGKIEIYGKTSTETGDITLKATNDDYAAGAAGQNIIIDHNGEVASGRDVNLVAENGDLHVTDRVSAQRDVNAVTQTKGDVYLDSDLTVNGSVTLKADIGNINADRVVTAGNRIEGSTKDGDVTLGTAQARYVALTSGGEDGHVIANTIRAQASGNSNGTGAEDVKLGGSYVSVNSVVNAGTDTVPLTISTLGSAEDKPMKDFNVGVRVADGVYTGGVESATGAVLQQLWADNAMLYVKGDTNLHVSKVVVNEKLHVANDSISVGVFGVPPTRDGERVVYWNDTAKNNPAGQQARWFDRSYADPAWMYLDLFGNGDIGSRYGVLIDTNGYHRIYGDSVSVVDTMRVRTDFKPLGSDIPLFDRFDLMDYQEVYKAGAAITDAQEDEIEIDTEEK